MQVIRLGDSACPHTESHASTRDLLLQSPDPLPEGCRDLCRTPETSARTSHSSRDTAVKLSSKSQQVWESKSKQAAEWWAAHIPLLRLSSEMMHLSSPSSCWRSWRLGGGLVRLLAKSMNQAEHCGRTTTRGAEYEVWSMQRDSKMLDAATAKAGKLCVATRRARSKTHCCGPRCSLHNDVAGVHVTVQHPTAMDLL